MILRTIICADSASEIYLRLMRTLHAGGATEYRWEACRGTPFEILALLEKHESGLLLIGDTAARKLPLGALREPMSARKLRVLVVSKNVQDSHFDEFLKIGYDGVVPADAPAPLVLKAIDAIFDGQLWVPRKILSRIVQQSIRSSTVPKMTARESEILDLISLGYKNQEIADRLFISRDTVRWHIRSLYSKIGVTNRIGAAQYAIPRVLAREY